MTRLKSGTVLNTHPIVIEGLAELANVLPDGDWYEMRVRLRKGPDGPEVYIVQTVDRLDTVYRGDDGVFWYRDENDELNMLDD